MTRGRARTDKARKLLTGTAAVALLAGALTLSTGLSHAAESCAGLDAAAARDRAYIADQRAHPDALSPARIATRQQALHLLGHRRAEAGCSTSPAPSSPAAGRR